MDIFYLAIRLNKRKKLEVGTKTSNSNSLFIHKVRQNFSGKMHVFIF